MSQQQQRPRAQPLPFSLFSLQGVWFASSVLAVTCSLLHALSLFSSRRLYVAALAAAAASYIVAVVASVPSWRTAASSRSMFWALFLSSDNVQYTLYCLVFATALPPVSLSLLPVALYALRQVAPVLRVAPLTERMPRVRGFFSRVCAAETQLGRMAVTGELFLLPTLLLHVVLGSGARMRHALLLLCHANFVRQRQSTSSATKAQLAAFDSRVSAFLAARLPALLVPYNTVVSFLARMQQQPQTAASSHSS